MKLYAPLILVSAFAMAACGEEPTPEPVPSETATPEPTPTVPAPDQELFSALFAETCPNAEAVNEAFCKRAMGAETASCEFSLGDDEYLRNDATLQIDETGQSWVIADAETVCAQ